MSGRRAHLALASRRPVAGANPPRAREGHPARSRPRRFPRAPPRAAASGDLRHSAPQETPITRTIVVLCHDVTAADAAGQFSTANLLQGRVDVWCRCVTAGLYLSDDVRRDAEVVLVLIPPVRSSSADAATAAAVDAAALRHNLDAAPPAFELVFLDVDGVLNRTPRSSAYSGSAYSGSVGSGPTLEAEGVAALARLCGNRFLVQRPHEPARLLHHG